MADAFEMREDRNPRFVLHARDQTFSAARHDHIDIAAEAGQHLADRRAVANGHQLDRILGQSGGAKALHHCGMDRTRRAVRIRAAAQDRGVAGLQAQRAGIGGDVRTAFIDHADHADRRADPLDGHAVRTLPFGHDLADRILELCDHLKPLGHRGDAAVVEGEAVEERAGDAGGLGLGHVAFVGGENVRRGGADRFRHRMKRLVLLRARSKRQRARRLAGTQADVLHQARHGGGGIDGFERRGHGTCRVYAGRGSIM